MLIHGGNIWRWWYSILAETRAAEKENAGTPAEWAQTADGTAASLAGAGLVPAMVPADRLLVCPRSYKARSLKRHGLPCQPQ